MNPNMEILLDFFPLNALFNTVSSARPLDSTLSEDDGIEPDLCCDFGIGNQTLQPSRRYLIHKRLDLIDNRLDLIHKLLDNSSTSVRSHPQTASFHPQTDISSTNG